MKIQEGDQTKFPTIILELCGKRFAFRVKEDQMKIIEMNPTDTVTTVFAKKKKKIQASANNKKYKYIVIDQVCSHFTKLKLTHFIFEKKLVSQPHKESQDDEHDDIEHKKEIFNELI